MLTVAAIFEYLEHTIAECQLSGNRVGLQRAQTAAGVLMAAAEFARDPAAAHRFRVLAAHAANKLEELDDDE